MARASIYPGERYGLDGCLTYELNAYSGIPAAAHRASYPLVEFYDTSQDAARFPGGQFVSRYYMTDLLEDDSIAVSPRHDAQEREPVLP